MTMKTISGNIMVTVILWTNSTIIGLNIYIILPTAFEKPYLVEFNTMEEWNWFKAEAISKNINQTITQGWLGT